MPDSAAFWTTLSTIALAIVGGAGALFGIQNKRIKSLEDKCDTRETEHAAYVERKQTEWVEQAKQIAALFETARAAEKREMECKEREAKQADEVRTLKAGMTTQTEEVRTLKARVATLEHPPRRPH